jgi:hypothetical protein
VVDQVQHADAYGLDWLVITDHGSEQHARIGVERVNPDIRAARRDFPDMLVFQGLEWNIPAAEHGTVFVHPGPQEVSFLKQFENDYDGVVKSATANTPTNEALALAGLTFLQDGVAARRVRDALMLANHPARQGVDSPHEIRGWRDTAPQVAVGMEGAPGHQAAGIPKPSGPGAGRGFYDNTPNPARAFAGYPPESYRTFGGFDWMTSTVGGLWDSLLAEGKPWWISANSDSHTNYLDTTVRGPGSDFAANGFYNDPVYGGTPNATAGDFWPGYYSRTHVGAVAPSYAAVMDGIRAGRMWVDHGGLLDGLDVRLRAGGQEVPLGGVLTARRGTPVRLVIRIDPARTPNWAQFVPRLAKVDVIRGAVTGAASDRDVFTAPQTRVVRTYDVSGQSQTSRPELRPRAAGRGLLRPAARLGRQPARRRSERADGRPGRTAHRRGRRRGPVEGPVVLHEPDVGAAVPVSRLVVGLDLEHLDERQADHDLLELVRSLPDGAVVEAATHWASGERRTSRCRWRWPGGAPTCCCSGCRSSAGGGARWSPARYTATLRWRVRRTPPGRRTPSAAAAGSCTSRASRRSSARSRSGTCSTVRPSTACRC